MIDKYFFYQLDFQKRELMSKREQYGHKFSFLGTYLTTIEKQGTWKGAIKKLKIRLISHLMLPMEKNNYFRNFNLYRRQCLNFKSKLDLLKQKIRD